MLKEIENIFCQKILDIHHRLQFVLRSGDLNFEKDASIVCGSDGFIGYVTHFIHCKFSKMLKGPTKKNYDEISPTPKRGKIT